MASHTAKDRANPGVNWAMLVLLNNTLPAVVFELWTFTRTLTSHSKVSRSETMLYNWSQTNAG